MLAHLRVGVQRAPLSGAPVLPTSLPYARHSQSMGAPTAVPIAVHLAWGEASGQQRSVLNERP